MGFASGFDVITAAFQELINTSSAKIILNQAPGWVVDTRVVRRDNGGRMEGLVEHCRSCGLEVTPYTKRYSIYAGEYFCEKCAERLDREYILKNTCALCGRVIAKSEVRFVLPSRLLGLQAGSTEIDSRLACVSCYNRFAKATRVYATNKTSRLEQIRSSIRKHLVRQQMLKAS